ncbi:MAG: chromate efflux transporter [Rhodocyclaceae bacterium]|nr:chromate efflux transporter [Rhodocyclaceae bacterium]
MHFDGIKTMISKPSFHEFLALWLRIGVTGFGGPAGQIALMHEELVTRRGWLGEAAFRHALGYCMVLPGPEAQQLATYAGWLLHGRRGGVAAGLLFILPGLVLVLALSWLLAGWGQLPLVGAALVGLKPAVLVLVAAAAWRMGGRLRAREGWVAAAALAATLSGLLHFAAIIGLAALAGCGLTRGLPASGGDAATSASGDAGSAATLRRADRPPTLRQLLVGGAVAVALWAACRALTGLGSPLLGDLADFFTRAALVTFGGAYAVLPYVFDVAVREAHWLSPAQMIDGLALGETTPGPLILVNSYIGFMAGWNTSGGNAGPALAAALVVTVFTFLPSFAFILVGAPWVERSRDLVWLQAPLRGISAAVVGLVTALGLTFAAHVLWPAGWVEASLSGGLDGRAVLLLAVLALLRVRWGLGGARLVAAGAALGLVEWLLW